MTPIDDELRSTLARRADSLAPSADPLAGIEARASRLRRRRTALAVSGAVAVVAAVALAVPALVPDDRPVPEQLGSSSPTATATASPPATAATPSNLLTWGPRGHQASSADVSDLRMRFARELDRPDGATSYSPLYGDDVNGVRFTMGQVWFTGEDAAYTVSYAVGPDNVPQFHLGPVTPKDPWGLAFLVSGFMTHDLLVVVPTPRTGQVSYSAHATGRFVPASGPGYGDGVYTIERDLQASDDRLQVLDGNGDLDHPTYEGPVTPLLCDLRSC